MPVIHLLDAVILCYVPKPSVADVDSQVNVLAILRIDFLVLLSSNSSQKHLRLHHDIIVIHDETHMCVRPEITLAIAVKPLQLMIKWFKDHLIVGEHQFTQNVTA